MSKLKMFGVALMLMLFPMLSQAAEGGFAEKLDSAVGFIPTIAVVILAVFGLLKVVVALTATKKDDKILAKVGTFLVEIFRVVDKVVPEKGKIPEADIDKLEDDVDEVKAGLKEEDKPEADTTYTDTTKKE